MTKKGTLFKGTVPDFLKGWFYSGENIVDESTGQKWGLYIKKYEADDEWINFKLVLREVKSRKANYYGAYSRIKNRLCYTKDLPVMVEHYAGVIQSVEQYFSETVPTP